MSTKVAGVTVSAKIKNERITVSVRRTTVHSMQFWASDYPYDEHVIDRKNWMAGQMNKSDTEAPFDLSEVTPMGWRIVEAAVAEADAVLVVA